MHLHAGVFLYHFIITAMLHYARKRGVSRVHNSPQHITLQIILLLAQPGHGPHIVYMQSGSVAGRHRAEAPARNIVVGHIALARAGDHLYVCRMSRHPPLCSVADSSCMHTGNTVHLLTETVHMRSLLHAAVHSPASASHR